MDLNKAKDLISGHSDKIDQGVDKAADLADEKTGGKNSQQLDQAAEVVKDKVGDFLDGGGATPTA